MSHFSQLTCIAVVALAASLQAQKTVPDAPTLKSAKGAFRRQHAAELRQKKPDAQKKLGQTLGQEATSAEAGSAKRFVLLVESVAASARGGDPRRVGLTLHRLSTEFAVQAGSQGAVAIKLLAGQKLPPHLRAAASDLALRLLGHAVYELDSKAAKALLRDAKKLSSPLKLGGLDAKLATLKKISGAAFKLHLAGKRAKAKLAKTPDHSPSQRAIEKAALFLHAGALSDTRTSEELWSAAKTEKNLFARARLLAEATVRPGAHRDEIRGRAWQNSIAWLDDFSAKGATDPALEAITKHVNGIAISRSAGWHEQLRRGPSVAFVPGRIYTWILETNLGVIRAELFPESAPEHVANILYLSACGYYDGITFHRVMENFMAQGGCPKGTGTTSPSYKLDTVKDPELTFEKAGVLAMANEDKPMTEAGQFFITFVPCPNLQGKHTIFGRVTHGMDVVLSMAKLASPGGKPKGEIKILRARADETGQL